MTKPGEPKAFLEQALASVGGGCIPWPFYRDKDGYGTIRQGKKQRVSRIACERVNGPPPTDKHQAAHKCGNTWCINGAHLLWKTAKQNDADKDAHGTRIKGTKHPFSKLTDEEVQTIRELRGKINQQKIADMFGIRQGTVNNIQLKRSRNG